jgi:hypothetical protein
MIKLPSLQRPYDFIFSYDPALKAPPSKPEQGATDDEIDAYRKAIAEYSATLTACRDTGNWAPLLIAGEIPLKFVLGHVDRSAFRAIADRCSLPDTSPQHIGDAQLAVLLTRLALIDVVGTDLKIHRAPDPEWNGWVMAQQDAIDRLDTADIRIVNQIGAHVWLKAFDISPKSSRG